MPPSKFPTPAPRRGEDSHQSHAGEHTDGQGTKKYPPKNTDTPRPGGKPAYRQGNDRPAPKRRGDGPRPPAARPRPAPEVPPQAVATPPPAVTDALPPDAGDGTLLPGIKPVTELLQTDPAKVDSVFIRRGRKGPETDTIIDLCRAGGVRFSLVDDTFLDRLWKGRHQGAIARLFTTGFMELDDLLTDAVDAPLPLVLVLDQVQDPGNAGTLARTLYALGGAGIVVPKHNGVYLGAAASRVAAGALEKLPVAKVSNLAQALDAAEAAGYTIYGTDASGRDTLPEPENVHTFTPRLPAILVLGGEDGGIRPIIRKRCASILAIPLAREFDSLNVAQAGAIIIAAFSSKCGSAR